MEVGCGDGRDAVEISQRVAWYEGFDPSEGLLEIARRRLPVASFVKADALSYRYPENVDIVFAFASLLHVDRDDLQKVFSMVGRSLRAGGIFFISLKESPAYKAEVKKDEYGERMFYYYNPVLVEGLSGTLFTTVYQDHRQIGKTAWCTVALQKS